MILDKKCPIMQQNRKMLKEKEFSNEILEIFVQKKKAGRRRLFYACFHLKIHEVHYIAASKEKIGERNNRYNFIINCFSSWKLNVFFLLQDESRFCLNKMATREWWGLWGYWSLWSALNMDNGGWAKLKLSRIWLAPGVIPKSRA